MHCITIHDVPDSTYQALSERARQHGRGVEDEVRVLLEGVGDAPAQAGTGIELLEACRGMALTDEEHRIFENIRDRSPARVVSFE